MTGAYNNYVLFSNHTWIHRETVPDLVYSRMSTRYHISGSPWNGLQIEVKRKHHGSQDSSSPRQPEETPEISHPSPMPCHLDLY